MHCPLCHGKGRYRTGLSRWVRCECQIVTDQQAKTIARQRYLVCSANYAKGHANMNNLALAAREAKLYWTEDQMVAYGYVDRNTLRRALMGWETFDV